MLSDLFWPSLQLFCTLIFTDFLRGVKYLTMSQFFPPTPKLSPPRVQKPQEIFHCHPTAVALPLCLCAYMPLPPWWSTYQMIIHMSAQLLCCQTCAHWPWRGVPFPQLINSLSLCWAPSAHWVVCDGVMVSMAQLSDCAASFFFLTFRHNKKQAPPYSQSSVSGVLVLVNLRAIVRVTRCLVSVFCRSETEELILQSQNTIRVIWDHNWNISTELFSKCNNSCWAI